VLTSAIMLLLTAVVAIRSVEGAKATSGGDPYSVPLVTDTNPDPNIVETTIVADETTVDIGNGVMAHAMTFNGTIPGPQFRLKVGDTVIVHFENHLASESTGIHWHGVEVNNASDGTPVTQNQVPPGGSFLYRFKVPRPGILWYHPHHHSSTNQVFKGLYGSIIVADPNEPALVSSGVLPDASRTRTLVLSDITVCKAPGANDTKTYNPALPWVGGGPLPAQAPPTPTTLCQTPIDDHGNPLPGPLAAGDVPNIQKGGGAGRTNEGQTVLTNGKNVGGRAGSPAAPGALAPGASTLDVQPGQGLRLMMINSSAVRYMRLRLTTSTGVFVPLVRVGGEEGHLDRAIVEGGTPGGFNTKYDEGETLLAPGERADIVAVIPGGASGVATLWTEDYSRTGQGFSNVPTVPVAHFKVTGPAGGYSIAAGTPLRLAVNAPIEVLGPATGGFLDPAVLGKTGLASQDIRLTQSPGSALGINGVQGVHDFPGDYSAAPKEGSARYARIGDILELTVTNATDANHPFHLHGFPIQPLEFTRVGFPTFTFPYHEFLDTIDVPARYTLRFRVRLLERPLMDGVTPGGGLGRWVLHCHILFHAVNGMVSELVVVGPDGNEAPLVNANGTTVQVNEGQTATMTGTYSDADGDAVTLTGPALGTLVDNHNGTWSWSYPATPGPDKSQILYVTATDAGGHKNQAAFQLTVNNLAPSVTINQAPGQADPTTSSPVNFTATFNEPVTGFDASDVTLAGTAGATTAVVTPAGTGATFNVAVSGMSSPGTVIATIGAGRATDLRGAPNTASTSTDNTVVFNQPPPFTRTLTGSVPGPVVVNAGDSVLITGAQVVGPVTVNPGGALSVVNSQVSRGITANAPSFLSLCAATVTGPPPNPALVVSNAPVHVRIGDPAQGCAGNRFTGDVTLTANLGATFGANTVTTNVTVTNGGSGKTIIKANAVSGVLACSGNNPVPTNAGQPNAAASRTGQCSAL